MRNEALLSYDFIKTAKNASHWMIIVHLKVRASVIYLFSIHLP